MATRRRFVSEEDGTDQQALVWQALVLAVRNPFPRRLEAFRNQSQYPWSDVTDFVIELAQRGGGDSNNSRTFTALITTMWECLIENGKFQNNQPTLKNIVAAIDQMPWAIDQAYPGYLDSGLLAKVLGPAAQRHD